jgi:hypothetical protein
MDLFCANDLRCEQVRIPEHAPTHSDNMQAAKLRRQDQPNNSLFVDESFLNDPSIDGGSLHEMACHPAFSGSCRSTVTALDQSLITTFSIVDPEMPLA